jgi:hypothetical protein
MFDGVGRNRRSTISSSSKIFPVSIESKNWKTKPGPSAMKQANNNKYKGTLPVVVWKPPGLNEKESLVMFKFTDFVKLMRAMPKEDDFV